MNLYDDDFSDYEYDYEEDHYPETVPAKRKKPVEKGGARKRKTSQSQSSSSSKYTESTNDRSTKERSCRRKKVAADEPEESEKNKKPEKDDPEPLSQEDRLRSIDDAVLDCPVKLVSYNKKTFWLGSFAGKPTKFQGVTTFLANYIFNEKDEYSRDESSLNPDNISKIVQQQTVGAVRELGADSELLSHQQMHPTARCYGFGKGHGIIVHHDLGYLLTKFSVALIKSSAEYKSFEETHHRSPDPCAVELEKHFKELGWMLIRSEYVVFDLACGKASAIDFLFRRVRDGNLIAVELKTGQEDIDQVNAATPKLRGPLADIDDTLLNRFSTQLLFSIMLEEMRVGQGHRWKFVDEAYIVHINSHTKRITRKPIAVWGYSSKRRKALYQFACDTHRQEIENTRTLNQYAGTDGSSKPKKTKTTKHKSTTTTEAAEEVAYVSDGEVVEW
ncbi:MAG: hypothetical protein JSS82_14050 [Bacteroidetes bacterium]|nr:hypothetical protein [Bacteroidota bacterium]